MAKRLDQLGTDFLIAVSLVLLTLLPLGLRAALVVMFSIPMSLALGVWLLHHAGFTLNQLSISGFVLSLGLLVDDSIVVVENIARHLRMGKTPVAAAIEGTRQISLAVLGCTATLLLAFLPLLFLPEGAGAFTRSLPVAVLLTVTASLFVSLTIIPFVASRVLKEEKHADGNWLLRTVMTGIHAAVSSSAAPGAGPSARHLPHRAGAVRRHADPCTRHRLQPIPAGRLAHRDDPDRTARRRLDGEDQ